jgi:hypothetical protein
MTSVRQLLPLLLAALPLAPLPVRACGPDFPNCYLTNSAEELSQLPALSFEQELLRLMPQGLPGDASRWKSEERAGADEIAELRACLGSIGLSEARVEELCHHYKRLEPPVEAPAEFQLYALGAKAWHAGKAGDALKAWETLLALPARERHFRTVWAWYMIGRAQEGSNPTEARKAYGSVRASIASGCADSAGLALASYGREGLTWLQEKRYAEALQLYLCQFALGDRSAAQSLQVCLCRLFRGANRGPEDEDCEDGTPHKPDEAAPQYELEKLARDPALRALVTSWFAARGGPELYWSKQDRERFNRWMACMPSVDTLPPAEAERWAWACYQNGRFEDARRLAEKAPSGAPAAEWVRAMLLLRSGFTEEAVVHLSAAAKGFALDPGLASPPKESSYQREEQQPLGDPAHLQLEGLRGVLSLHREHYEEALRLFLENNHWADAAYVAERVLSLDELKAYVDAHSQSGKPGEDKPGFETQSQLRHLLARRLVRAARFDEALSYFPDQYRESYTSYVAAVRRAHDSKLDATSRAEAFWKAAESLRNSGMEIQGSELAPDYQIWGGSFQWPDIPWLEEARRRQAAGEDQPGPAAGPFAPGRDELERISKDKHPTERFHYRLHAAELALLGSSLLPNNDPKAAEMLHESGLWLSARWPAEADLYYKLLLVRCPDTELARAAREHHWFLRTP